MKKYNKTYLSSELENKEDHNFICPYCKKVISSLISQKKIQILKEIRKGNMNMLSIKRNIKNAYSTIYQHISDLEFNRYINKEKGFGREGRNALILSLTKKGENLLENLK